MKLSNLSKFVGAGVIALSMAAMPIILPVSAQTDSTGTTGTTGATGTTGTTGDAMQNQGTENVNTGDRDFDWGWLGLLGLGGLAGLAKRSEPVRYQDPNPVGGTGTTGYREP